MILKMFILYLFSSIIITTKTDPILLLEAKLEECYKQLEQQIAAESKLIGNLCQERENTPKHHGQKQNEVVFKKTQEYNSWKT